MRSPASDGYSPRMGDGRLDGKVAIITGAAGGIGAAAARRLAQEGARLLLTDADEEGARRVAQELGGEIADALGHDVTSEEQWQAVLAHVLDAHGRVDVLLNNAGVFLAKPLTQTGVEEFRRVLDVNVTGVFLGMRTVAPAMLERQAGSIINISSVAGLIGPPMLTAYAASKWAVRGITKVAAKELAHAGVRVNSLHPGQIDTDMNTRQREQTPELIDKLIRGIPLRRIGQPEEVAEAIVYLASAESVYVTGSELAIDGGVTA
jgi:3alpha(or 20beta)-hydroxysteroid dehydrogenase